MKEKYSITSNLSQMVFEGRLKSRKCSIHFVHKFSNLFHETDETIGKTLSDGTKKFTLDEAIQIAGEFLCHKYDFPKSLREEKKSLIFLSLLFITH